MKKPSVTAPASLRSRANKNKNKNKHNNTQLNIDNGYITMRSNHENNRRTWKKLESRARHSSEKTRPTPPADPGFGRSNARSNERPIDDQVKERCQVELHGKMKSWHESLREFICLPQNKENLDQTGTDGPVLDHDDKILAALELNHTADCAMDRNLNYDDDMLALHNHYMSLIQKSPLAQMMLDDLEDHGWAITLTQAQVQPESQAEIQAENQAYSIDHDQREIVIYHFGAHAQDIRQCDDTYCQIFMNILRAMRDAWQDMRLNYDHHAYHPESILMIEKLRAADSDIVALLCAQEIDSATQDESQNDLLFIEYMAQKNDRAIAIYFQPQSDINAPSTPTIARHKIMAAMAFQTWFKDTARVNMVEHDILSLIDDHLAENQNGNAFGQTRINAMDITRIGCLPDGTSYLAGISDDIINNPNFVGLNDPINQAHYFHIIRDMNAVMVGGVPFRSEKLAALIFPDA